MTSPVLKAVLFDLDGTLLDTLPDLAHAANAMRLEMQMPALDEALIGTFIGKGVDNLVRRTLSASLTVQDINQEVFSQARAIFDRHYTEINGRQSVFYPGVREGIAAFAGMGLKLGVVTNKPTVFTLPLLERTGLIGHMQTIVCGDTCEQRKPDPAPVLFACRQLGVAPAETLAIGDSINDALAARGAGCKVLAVPYGYNEGESVDQLPVDGIVSTIADASHWAKHHYADQTW